MITNHIQIKEVSAEEANHFAAQLTSQVFKNNRSANGAATKAQAVFGWSSWTDASQKDDGFLILLREEPALAMWLESDVFNSKCLQVEQARLHWVLDSSTSLSGGDLLSLSTALSYTLDQSDFNLVSARIFGHHPVASGLFHRAAFRMVIGNAWLYRWPIKPLKIGKTPEDVSFELRNVNEQPLCDGALSEYLEVAAESFFADRFSLDLNLNEALVRQRFLSIVENALRGEIADYAMTARSKSGIEAFAFFAVEESPQPNAYPQAGKWLTLITRRSIRAQGIAHFVIAEAIRRLPEGKANWLCSCALDNFGSLRTAQKMGFEIGSIVYDMHRWRAN